MKKWPTKSLGEICELYQPKTITSAEILSEGPYKVFGANGVIGFYGQYNHEEAEVAVTCRGATCGTVNFTAPKSWITGNAMVVTPKDKCLDKRYLFYTLKASDMASVISGSAQPQITRQSFAPMKIPVPPPEDQERIVKLLDEADELRKQRAHADRRATTLIPGLFHEMFGDPVANPKGWPLVQLGDIAPLKSGYAFKSIDYTSEGVRLVRISNLDGQNLVFGDGTAYLPHSFLNDCPAFQLVAGDVLIAMSGATTGKLGQVRPTDVPSLLNQRVGKFFIRDANRLEPTFLFSVLGFHAMTRKLIGEAAGSAQANVSPSNVGSVEIPLPPIELQKEFARRMTEIRELEASQATSRTRLDALFQSMLHRAFNGDL